jgi:hypothetical protein
VRLYHYLESKWALDDLRRRRLKTSRIDDMNDPYEFRCVYSDDKSTQQAVEQTRREVVEKYNVLCFSRVWNDILMWSHYAEKHKGICLGFDVPDEITRPVDYTETVSVCGNLIVHSRAELDMERGLAIVERNLGTKYAGWAYEQEVREHVNRADKDEETGHFFVDFSERLILREVIAGVRFPFSRRPIEEALKEYSGQVKITKAACSPKCFEIVIAEQGW